ncbi:hypothetical protein GGX14DRAFT_673623 [Mycena pura]|uniref:Uncharacterized protein n=1 Tax=Mycena pura TaxID=153505 RepID=A0AAD6Y6D5_9AGAR|nr:hypothetical protein GGX14DRAFT_673623 [Mycena pura]
MRSAEDPRRQSSTPSTTPRGSRLQAGMALRGAAGDGIGECDVHREVAIRAEHATDAGGKPTSSEERSYSSRREREPGRLTEHMRGCTSAGDRATSARDYLPRGEATSPASRRSRAPRSWLPATRERKKKAVIVCARNISYALSSARKPCSRRYSLAIQATPRTQCDRFFRPRAKNEIPSEAHELRLGKTARAWSFHSSSLCATSSFGTPSCRDDKLGHEHFLRTVLHPSAGRLLVVCAEHPAQMRPQERRRARATHSSWAGSRARPQYTRFLRPTPPIRGPASSTAVPGSSSPSSTPVAKSSRTPAGRSFGGLCSTDFIPSSSILKGFQKRGSLSAGAEAIDEACRIGNLRRPLSRIDERACGERCDYGGTRIKMAVDRGRTGGACVFSKVTTAPEG